MEVIDEDMKIKGLQQELAKKKQKQSLGCKKQLTLIIKENVLCPLLWTKMEMMKIDIT